MDSLTDAQVLLLAAQYVAEPDLSQLQLLAATRSNILTPSLIYRVLLTYLPTETSVELSLSSFLKSLEHGFQNISDLDATLDQSTVQDIASGNAEEKLKSLRLESLPKVYGEDPKDQLTNFLVEWTHRMESVSGITASTLSLVDSQLSDHPNLQHWRNTYLLPLCRLQIELYPAIADILSLREIENIHGVSGVNVLLQFAVQGGENADISRDLDQVVSPWVLGSKRGKRRRLSLEASAVKEQESTATWHDVNEWIRTTSNRHYELAAKAILEWRGPRTMDGDGASNPGSDGHERTLAYAQTALALAYTTPEDNASHLDLRRALLQRSAILVQLMPPDFEKTYPDITDVSSLLRASKADLLENALLKEGNPFTTPSTDAADFLHGVLATQKLLQNLKLTPSTIAVASTTVLDSEERQKQELRTILGQIPKLTRSNIDWQQARKQLLWLHGWQETDHPSPEAEKRVAYLSKISRDYLETSILDAILATGDHNSVISIYIQAGGHPLQISVVQDRVIVAIYNAYDNASNGNRTRGGIKRASDMLKAFQPHFKDAPIFTHIDHLIRATHSLSFYQLTLQHGVPFRPASVRVNRDPLSLIDKVLEQNQKAYTKLDDLLEIGRNLVLGDLPTPLTHGISPDERSSIERRVFDAEHRITYQAITSALDDQDFDTAYSYITTRLSTSVAQSQKSLFTDDTSWRAAYAAGKFRPTSASANLHDRIASLSKRMDLLSLALTLAPTPAPLSEILGTWRRCEEEMDSLKAEAVQEERSFDVKGETTVPGGFEPDDRELDAAETRRMMERRAVGGMNGPSYEEEAPVGLFDVARGAASAFRNSAFPLRGAGAQGIKVHQTKLSQDSGRGSGEFERASSDDGQQRLRKRDMISNAVTGGLVSGMSWVLGAQPMERPED